MAEVAKNKVYFRKLHQNIVNNKNNSKLSEKFDLYLSRLEQELNDLEFRTVSNLNFENDTNKTNSKLNILEYILFGFVGVLNILEIGNKDDKILRIKKLFKKKIIDLSFFINDNLKVIIKNTNRLERRLERKKMIMNCYILQDQLNTLYSYYEDNLKNSNNSTKKLFKKYSNNIKDTMNQY